MSGFAGDAGNDNAMLDGARVVRGDKDDDKDAAEGEHRENSLNTDESTVVEGQDKQEEESSRKRSGGENLDVLASMASHKLRECTDGNRSSSEKTDEYKEKATPDLQVGKGGGRHHLLRHALDPSKIGENAVKFFYGAENVEEALALASTMSQKELQRTFSLVYGVNSSSNNNNWLRKKLMEALAPKMWREAWDRYMDEPFSNRGKKDRLRKERESQDMKEKNAKSAKYAAFDHFRSVAAQQAAAAGLVYQGMNGGHCPMVPPNYAHTYMQYQGYPNEMHMPSSYERCQVQESQNELVQALNTMSNLLVQYMSGHRYPQSHPGGYASYQQYQNPYADFINANSGHYGAGVYGQNQMYNRVSYPGIPTGHTPSMHGDGLQNVGSSNNSRDSISKEQIISMLKHLVNKRPEEQAAKMREVVNDSQKEAIYDDQKDVVVPTKDKDLVDPADCNMFNDLVKKLQSPSCNGSPSKDKKPETNTNATH